MKKCILVELRKALTSKTMIVTCIMVVVLAVWHAVGVINNNSLFWECLKNGDIEGNPMLTSMSLFCRWLGADVSSFESNVFFFLMPVIVIVPYGWSQVNEMKSRYTINLFNRISRRDYFISKYIATFLSASIVVLLPLLVNVITLSLFIPALKIENIYPYGALGQRSMWSEFYYESPFLYLALYILVDVIFAGLIAVLCNAVAFFIKNRITVMLSPFFLMLFIDYFDTNFNIGWELSPIKFLHAFPVANDRMGQGIFLFGCVMLVVTIVPILYKGKKYEVF